MTELGWANKFYMSYTKSSKVFRNNLLGHVKQKPTLSGVFLFESLSRTPLFPLLAFVV